MWPIFPFQKSFQNEYLDELKNCYFVFKIDLKIDHWENDMYLHFLI